MKISLEDYCKEVIQRYHSTVVEQLSTVKDQLDEIRLKNGALNTSVAIIDEKFEEIIHGKNEQFKEIEKQWMEKIKALCDQFEQFTQERNKELEKTQSFLMQKEDIELLKNKIYSLEMKLESKRKDEEALQATLTNKYTILKDEFIRLKSEIECDTQQQHENLSLKVSELKKAVVKLEKSKEKIVYDYEKKMLREIQNKNLEIKSLQLQLQEQRNEFSTLLNTKKQSEVDNIAAHLEKRYKTLLAEKDATTEFQTQEYLKKIAELEDQVLSLKTY
nr:coiled-coil domain-containing protein 18-like isoform X1 [Nomia melanderi]